MAGITSNGGFTRSFDWTDDRDAGVKIRADRNDTELDNIATALGIAFYRDGRATATGAFPMGGYKITGMGTPTNSGDAATKGYVDSVATPAQSLTVVAATTANVNLTTNVDDGSAIDGVTVATGQAILLKDQTSQLENGVYVVPAAAGTATRHASFDTWNEHIGSIIAVSGGSTNGSTLWRCMVNSGGTLETTAITYAAAGAAITLPLTLSSGGTGVALATPSADNGFFYDLSAGMGAWWAPTGGITFSGTSLTLDIVGTTGATVARGDSILFSDVSNSNLIRSGLVSDALDLAHPLEAIVLVCSAETAALTAGTGKITFRMPYAFTASSVKASLNTAQSSGSIFTVDINESGTTILSTKLTIDNGEKTSATAVTPAVISDTALAADAEISVDVDQIGDGLAAGLKVTIVGRQA
jgi:hypothetical protein